MIQQGLESFIRFICWQNEMGGKYRDDLVQKKEFVIRSFTFYFHTVFMMIQYIREIYFIL